LQGREAIRQDFQDFVMAFPDVQMQLDHTLSKGEIGAMHGEMTGTHKNALAGPEGSIPATNRRVQMRGAVFCQLNRQGLIAEEWRYLDTASLMQQLGIEHHC
jgi:predicted ester cyclase